MVMNNYELQTFNVKKKTPVPHVHIDRCHRKPAVLCVAFFHLSGDDFFLFFYILIVGTFCFCFLIQAACVDSGKMCPFPLDLQMSLHDHTVLLYYIVL